VPYFSVAAFNMIWLAHNILISKLRRSLQNNVVF
jgi:hypothetical protein